MRALIALLLLLFSVSAMKADDKRLLTGQQWYDALQAIGAKYQAGKTQAQNNLRRKQLIADLAAMKDVRVQMTSTVKEVRWKGGVAQIYTNLFLPAPDPRTQRPPLRLVRTLPLELRMDEEAAAAIEPGTPVKFQGTLHFHERLWGAVGRSLKVQQMHTVSHQQLLGAALGTYTSSDCVISVGGTIYPTRWAPQ